MSTSPEQLHYLLLQYANNNCTRQELLLLLQAMDEAGHNEALHTTLLHIWQNISDTDQLPGLDKEVLFSNIMAAAPVQALPARKYTWFKIAAAAVLVLALGSLGYIYLSKKEQPPKSIVQLTPFKNDKAARIGKAILSLPGGKEIILDDAPIGTLATLGHTTIIKRTNRQLMYTIDANAGEMEEAPVNILTTPPGSQYEIVLSDESHVWVNTASAIRFPTAFTGHERNVAMTGEAYFEVAKNAQQPFIVNIPALPGSSGGGRVEVLGTHFNIKAYDDDREISTTLLEGRVKFSALATIPAAKENSQLLSPGQQAQLKMNGNIQVTDQVNVNEVIAWKKGELIFNNLTLAEAASVIERWYNVQLEIKNPQIANCRITVSFLKGETIQQVMDVISAYNDLTWKMKNGAITISGKGCE